MRGAVRPASSPGQAGLGRGAGLRGGLTQASVVGSAQPSIPAPSLRPPASVYHEQRARVSLAGGAGPGPSPLCAGQVLARSPLWLPGRRRRRAGDMRPGPLGGSTGDGSAGGEGASEASEGGGAFGGAPGAQGAPGRGSGPEHRSAGPEQAGAGVGGSSGTAGGYVNGAAGAAGYAAAVEEGPQYVYAGFRDGDVVYRPQDEQLWQWLISTFRMSALAAGRYWSMLQLVASVVYVVLYIYSTYVPVVPWGTRYVVELCLCGLFAVDFLSRTLGASSPLRKALQPGSILELVTFLPQLLDASLPLLVPAAQLPWITSLRVSWFKLFRILAVTRRVLLAGQMRGLHLSSSTEFLNSVSVARVFTLVSSVLALILTSSCVIQIVERIPWHDALYLSSTTLTTVGLGDVSPASVLGKMAVIVIVLISVVTIPVQASQVYQFLQMRRRRCGNLPSPFQAVVLVATRLSDMRAFGDFFSEFWHELESQAQWNTAMGRSLPLGKTKMVCLTNRPSFEFQAFQELNFRRLTLLEGSVLSESDLEAVAAPRAKAALLIADRFSPKPDEEDKALIFQVWSMRSYTSTVPLFVQTLSKEAMVQIKPFLDPAKDMVISLEDVRFSLLAISVVCPGASTLIGNILRSTVPPRPTFLSQDTMAGMRWLREYVDGTFYKIRLVPCDPTFQGLSFTEAAECLYRRVGAVLIGVRTPEPLPTVLVNPARMSLRSTEALIVLVRSETQAQKCASVTYTPPLMARVSKSKPSKDEVTPADAPPSRGTLLGLLRSPLTGALSAPHAATTSSDGSGPERPASDAEVAEHNRLLEGSDLRVTSMSDSSVRMHRGRGSSRSGALARSSIDFEVDPIVLRAIEDDIEKARRAEEEAAAEGGEDLSGHVVVCGDPHSFLPFCQALRQIDCSSAAIVILHPQPLDESLMAKLVQLGNLRHVRGTPTDPAGLHAAQVRTAQSFVFLAARARPPSASRRPAAPGEAGNGHNASDATAGPLHNAFGNTAWRASVLADAEALLTCYSVGEGLTDVNALVELTHTSSIRFIQPGLLLPGVEETYRILNEGAEGSRNKGQASPRPAYLQTRRQERAAADEGLAGWQVNSFFASGRVTVPALMDTLTCQAFFSGGLLPDLFKELQGSRQGGTPLRLLRVPKEFVGRTYQDCAAHLILHRRVVPMGLYRFKEENALWRLPYVHTNPPGSTVLRETDRVYVLRERGGEWLVEDSKEAAS